MSENQQCDHELDITRQPCEECDEQPAMYYNNSDVSSMVLCKGCYIRQLEWVIRKLRIDVKTLRSQMDM